MTETRSISDLKHLDPNDRFEGAFFVQSKNARNCPNTLAP